MHYIFSLSRNYFDQRTSIQLNVQKNLTFSG